MKSVIGIDPGSEKSAFVLWNGKEILDKGIYPNEDLFNILRRWGHSYEGTTDGGVVLAIESMISIPGGGGKSVCDTIRWEGQFYRAWAWEGRREFVPVHVIRKALGAKNDPGIRAVLIQRFGAPGTAKNPGLTHGLQGKGYHLWRAFAVCVAHWDHLEFQGRELK